MPMSLADYKKKRSFTKTSEPEGGKGTGEELRFVVQKHAASHLHYDFRLEMGGVLKSWAVPKGPSTDPTIKRLAMMVEDHPYDYRNFEGIIPKGEYGGGTVIVWDEGTYESIEKKGTLKEQEKYLLKELKNGSVKVVLKGKKLKGEFALVKTHGMAENSWLLLKHKDKFASTADITAKDKSVISNQTIEQIAKNSTTIYGQDQEKAIEENPVKKVAKALEEPEKKATRKPAKSLIKGAEKTPFFDKVAPMLATLVDRPIDDDNWAYEIKWDGYRAVAFMNKGEIELKSRNNKSFNEKFYPVYQSLKEWGINAVVDGEVVVINEKGMANFGALQNWRSEADGELLYYVFDILWYDGYDTTQMPLTERRELLKKLVPAHSLIQLSRTFETSGTEFLAAAKKMGLEGIMAKRKDSLYDIGNRTKNWLKIKSNKRQEVVIGGYTKNDDTSKPFSALLVGVFEKGKFIYTGKIGTGFNQKTQKEMLAQFEPLVISKPPFDEEPDINKPSRFRPNPPHATATWLKPELICEVSFAEMTSDGVMRHPSFEGMRDDKKAKEVVLEKEANTTEIVNEELTAKYLTPQSAAAKNKRKTLLNPTDATQVRKVNGHDLKFSNLSKIYWPTEKITKRELINYYYQVAPYLLPYLKNRPQSLNRHPGGITGPSFYQKDVTGKVPDWMDTYLYHTDESDEDKHFLLGNNEATLLYMVGLGCIEINPWSSTIKKPDYPTWCIIDLDPSDNTTFEEVIQAAQVTKQVLDDMGVPSYCKTSGSTGLHIYIPLGAKYTYEQSKEFARVVVTLVHRELPKFTSLERAVKDRKGKMYLDFLQNRASATIAAPYSARPKAGATVSMPLHWDEVKIGLKMKDFTIFNALARIESVGDIFQPVLGKGIDLKKVISSRSNINKEDNDA
jgi:bifunctional non-homologous end joining protein LigD